MGTGLLIFTLFHTAISLVALVAGILLLLAYGAGGSGERWTNVFLTTGIATSATGFLFPFSGVTPAFIVGIVAIAAFLLTLGARYGGHFAGWWRGIYAATIAFNVYLLAFVTVVQAFQKVGFLRALAPTQSEAPFAVAQILILAIFLFLGYRATRRFSPPA